MREWWRKIEKWFKELFNNPDPAPDPVPGPTPVHDGMKIAVAGTGFQRGGQAWSIIGKSIDWAVQPTDFDSFKAIVNTDAELSINLYVAFSAPGLGKPIYVPNGSGRPYTDNATLQRHEPYWQEVDRRISYANEAGISVVVANTFVDQGVVGRYTLDALKIDWRRTVARYADKSAMFLPLSEYNEGGAAGINAGRALAAVTSSPKTLHPVGSSAGDEDVQDFICHQGFNIQRAIADYNTYGKPVMFAEDQQAKNDPALKIARFKQARQLGMTYIFTGNNFQWSSQEANYLRSL